MRLRQIVEMDFRRSELTNWLAFKQQNEVLCANLEPRDVIAFLSSSHKQIVFLSGFTTVTTVEGTPHMVLASTRQRLVDGAWSPYMLANYARAAGLRLEGMKLFEEHFAHLITEKSLNGGETK